MGNVAMVSVLLIALLFAVAFGSVLWGLMRTKRRLSQREVDVQRLQGELEQTRQIATAKEANLQNRIADKETSCQQLIASKEEAYARAIGEKMSACEQLLRAKDDTCARIIAEKNQILQQLESSCAKTIAEKDAACKRILEEKDQALRQKDEACAATVAEKERVCTTTIAAKERACSDIIAEKDAACKRILEEKDQALRQKDEACAVTVAEKERACAAAIAAKEKACSEIIAEKDAALVRKDVDCKRVIDEKDAEIAKFLQEKEKSFAAVVETLKEQFANIAMSQLKAHSEGLSKANRANLDGLLAPVRDQVKLLQELAEKAQRETHTLGVSMTKDVLDMGKIAKSLQNVATALTSNTRFQGRKGEEILVEKLRQAGLEEGINFFIQSGTETDRPDAQVCDTENRWLIIDSKVSLTAYMEYMDATDDAVKAEKLAQHVASVRQKIDQLAKKKYPKVFSDENRDRNYLPITAMFVPYEAPLMEALKAEPSLWQHAAENNVILITPLTLLAYLRLVYLAWQHEKEARNQLEIVNTARELLARMNGFLTAFEDVGHALNSLSGTYDKAKGILVDAPHAHTIANSARKLIDLHVRLENKKGKRLDRAACLKDADDEAISVIPEQASVS